MTVDPTYTATNLIPNPSAEIDATLWSASGATLARSTAQHFVGIACFSVTCTGTSSWSISTNPRIAVTAGTTYTASAYFRANTTVRAVRMAVQFFNAAGTSLGSATSGTAVNDSTTAWTRASYTVTAPAGAATASVIFQHSGTSVVGEVHYVDAVMFSEGSLIDYFDGDTPDTRTTLYGWTGTPHASSSVLSPAPRTVATSVNALNPRMAFRPTDVIKVQVEADADVKNLVPNPNGDLGAWGWSTPVANTTLTSTQPHTYSMYAGVRKTTGQIQITIANTFGYQGSISIRGNGYLADGDYAVISQATRTVGGFIGTVTDFFIADTDTATVDTDITGGTVGLQPSLVLTAVASSVPQARLTDQPFTAGKYLQGRLNIVDITVAHQALIWVYFLDANHTVLSSINTTIRPTAKGTFFFGPNQAPANTAYASIGIFLYNGTGTTPANAGASVTFNNVQIVQSDAASSVQQRKNYFTNPSIEASTDTFGTRTGITMARDTAQHYAGAASIRYTRTSSAPSDGEYAFFPAPITLTPNTTYTLSFYVKSSGATTMRYHRWFYSASTDESHDSYQDMAVGTTWKRLVYTFNSGIYTQLSGQRIDIVGAFPTNLWFDGFLLEKASSAGTYFDGSTSPGGGWTVAWDGAVNASTSTASSPASHFDYVPPVTYIEIQDNTTNTSIQRSGLDVGTMQVTTSDETLDPSKSSALRKGKRIQVLTVDGTGAWVPLFVGKISNAHASYTPPSKPGKKPITNITVTATDAVTDLANTTRTQSVADISGLPWVLEGVQVPWDVMGVTGQPSTAPVVAGINESASALDQVALTRDTPRYATGEGPSYAWVSRNGVLHVLNANGMAARTAVADVTDAHYNSNFKLDFDSDALINEVFSPAISSGSLL